MSYSLVDQNMSKASKENPLDEELSSRIVTPDYVDANVVLVRK